jgi:putative FmdB family regulatory protein
MPLFKYHCENCQEEFEDLVSFSESNNVECPHCGSKNTQKKVSAFATLGGSTTSASVGSCGSGGFT